MEAPVQKTKQKGPGPIIKRWIYRPQALKC